MRETLNAKILWQQCFELLQLVNGYHQIQIQTHCWLHVGIDALSANYTIVDAMIAQQRDQPFEQVGAVHCYRLPKRECAHRVRSEEHTSELQSQSNLVCRLL